MIAWPASAKGPVVRRACVIPMIVHDAVTIVRCGGGDKNLNGPRRIVPGSEGLELRNVHSVRFKEECADGAIARRTRPKIWGKKVGVVLTATVQGRLEQISHVLTTIGTHIEEDVSAAIAEHAWSVYLQNLWGHLWGYQTIIPPCVVHTTPGLFSIQSTKWETTWTSTCGLAIVSKGEILYGFMDISDEDLPKHLRQR